MADDVSLLLKIVPDDYVRAAGLVVTQWAWAESILDQYIWRMLGVRALRGRIVTSNIQARLKIEMLAALLRKSNFDEPFVKEIEDEGKALANFRNLVAHGAIVAHSGLAGGEATIGSYSARGRLQTRSRRVDLKRLEVLALRIATYTQFLIEGSNRLPKQRGIRQSQEFGGPKRRNLRIDTILRQLPPLLEVERQKGPSGEEMKAAKALKLARKILNGEKAKKNDPEHRKKKGRS
jgi:hypothetical protein